MPASVTNAPPTREAHDGLFARLRRRARSRFVLMIAAIGLVASLLTAAPVLAPPEAGIAPTASAASTRCSWRYGYPPCRIFLTRGETAAVLRGSVAFYTVLGGLIGGPWGAGGAGFLANEANRWISRSRPCLVLSYPHAGRLAEVIRVRYARSC